MKMNNYRKNIQYKKYYTTTVAIIMYLCFCFTGTVFAKDDKNIKLQKEEKKELPSNITDKIKPELGARGSFIMPFGTPAPYLGYGYGGALYFDLSPYEYKLFSLRLGFTSEFMYFQKNTTATSSTLMLFPEYVHMKFLIQFPFGLMLYPKVGCGISIALLKKSEYKIFNLNKASFDLTAIGGLGIGYNPPKVKNLVIFIEANYMMLFESVNGQFLTGSLGFAYKF
jgi:hypothetical protein